VTVYQNFKNKWLAKLFKSTAQGLNSKYVNLAATDKADEEGVYYDALSQAIEDPDVYNIALTGPYGSGKSSVIKAFLAKYKKTSLQISLAAFLPEGDTGKSEAKKQEIERSILQQMLYGADASDLPYSRFKRIKRPSRWAPYISLLLILGSFVIWYLYQHRKEIVTGDFFIPLDSSNWFNLACFTFGFLFLWSAAHQIYRKSLGLSLKGISLKNLELTPEDTKEESILNRHLDEIIYFFQSTAYELVIIEDLDRFDNPDIFVTLREINGLINANAGIKRQVRFLYALRDDMFAHTDRTKFFEFIVPVIPIINNTNSIDKVREHAQRLLLDEDLDKQFLREVSRYLNDLRLIHNIFNEYAVYVANLEKEEKGVLDPNKLLAVLIYKNVLPRDFENLHQQKGILAEILRQYDKYILNTEEQLKRKLQKIEEDVKQVENLSIKDETELRKVYAMALIEQIPANNTFVKVGNITSSFTQLAKHEQLNQFLTTDRISSAQTQNHSYHPKQISPIQNIVDPDKTFEERIAEIQKKDQEFKTRAEHNTREIRVKIQTLRTQKFNEVIRAIPKQAEALFNKFDDSKDLMKFLIFEGHLDDTYYQYISLFHSGRLSPSDNKFLIQIRSFNNPEPEFQIDNPAEVVEEMRDEDFSQCYVLNCHLIDYLFDNPENNEARIKNAVGYISSNFASCDEFFASYFITGRHVEALIKRLISDWANYPQAAAEGTHGPAHVARITAYAPKELLSVPSLAKGKFSICWDTHTFEILSEGVDLDLNRLKLLGVEVKNLKSIEEFSKEVEYVIEHGLYQVTVENIRFVLEQVVHAPIQNDMITKNYTTVLSTKNRPLIKLIEQNFGDYVKRVLLRLETNTKEEASAVLKALEHEEVKTELLEKFLSNQSAILPSLAEIPDRFHSAVLKNQKIDPTWGNCLLYLDSESYSSDILTKFLEDTRNRKPLLSSPVPDGEDTFNIRNFLISNDGFENEVYREYIHRLPKQFQNFPCNISQEKLRIIIEEQKAVFTPENFSNLEGSDDLQVLFVAKNITAFLEDLESYNANDDFLMKLLSTDIRNDQKFQVLQAINPELITDDATKCSVAGQILNMNSVNSDEFDYRFIGPIIVHSSPVSVQVRLLNKFHAALTSEEVTRILYNLPDPYRSIPLYGNYLHIPDTPENRELAQWLKDQKIISSSKLVNNKKQIRINKFKKSKVE